MYWPILPGLAAARVVHRRRLLGHRVRGHRTVRPGHMIDEGAPGAPRGRAARPRGQPAHPHRHLPGLHKPRGQSIADEMPFMVAAMAAEMERDDRMAAELAAVLRCPNSPPAPPEAPVNCAAIPELQAAADPHARCLSDPRIELDNARFAQAVSNVAAGLAADGIERGDVVAVTLPNRAETIVAMFASWSLGAAMTPINPALTADAVRLPASRLRGEASDRRARLGGRLSAWAGRPSWCRGLWPRRAGWLVPRRPSPVSGARASAAPISNANACVSVPQ